VPVRGIRGATTAAEARSRADRGAFELGDYLLHRSAGRRLDHHEIDHHDRKQRGDDQQ